MKNKSIAWIGLLFFLLVSTFESAKSQWALTGNNITSSNFIGSLNAQPFVIKTNDTTRMLVDQFGRVGINTSTPGTALDIRGTLRIRGVSSIFGGANGIDLETNSDSADQGGYIEFLNTKSKKSYDFIQGSNCGTPGDNLNIIYYPDRTISCTNFKQVLTIHQDSIGIRVATPTANFHVNGSVRFQNLPTGSGTALVIDANGNIFRSSASLSRTSADSTQAEIDELKEEISSLKQMISQLQSKINNSSLNNEKATLFPNYPNPLTNVTTIGYYLPNSVKRAKLLIFDNTGKEISNAILDERGRQNLTIQNNGLTPGIYYYSLIADGKKVDTKKMVISK